MPVRVLIAAGGTVGHVAPALAVADRLRARGAEVEFAGTPERVEATLVPARGYPFHPFHVSGLARGAPLRAVAAAGRAAVAPAACIRILRRVRPDVVYGAGGYVAGPMLAAAATLRIPAVLSEADAHLGLANRLAAPFARRVLLAYPVEGRDGERYRVVGRPVDAAFGRVSRTDGRAAFGLDRGSTVIAVFGGSLGAAPLNEAIAAAFPGDLPEGIELVHVTGRGKAGAAARARYVALEFTDAMPQLLAAADLVVCRAGGSVFEVAAAGRAAILVPWRGAAGDHQAANARHFGEAGAAVVIPDAELTGARLRREIDGLLSDPRRREAMAAAMRELARPHAADEIADEVLALAGGDAGDAEDAGAAPA